MYFPSLLKNLRRKCFDRPPRARPIHKQRTTRLFFEQLEDRVTPSTVTDCGTFNTVTQGGWGADPNGNNPGQYLADNFEAAFPDATANDGLGSIQIGNQASGAADGSNTSAGQRAAQFTSAAAINAFLAHGGTPGALTSDFVNPTDPPPPDPALGGTLSGNTLALALNVGFDVFANPSNPTPLGGLIYTGSGPLNGLTVNQILGDANLLLSGGTSAYGASASDLTDAASNINNNFDGGANLGFLDCPPVVTTSTVTIEVHKFEDNNGDGIRNGADADIPWSITIVVGSNSYVVTNGTAATFDPNNDGYSATDPGDATFDGHVLSVTVTTADLSAGISWSATEADVSGWTHTTATSDSGTLTTANSSAVALDFGNFENILITGHKFYDTNANGLDDDGAVVAGMVVVLTDVNNVVIGTAVTDSFGNYTFGDLDNADLDNDVTTGSDLGPGTYHVNEVLASLGGTWVQTFGFGGYTITAGGSGVQSGGTSSGNDFGNVKLGAGGGFTLGFWSNKNGQKVIFDGNTAIPELTMLNNLCLANASGADTNFSLAGTGTTGYTQFKNWLLSATATNMAYMLSAQLATMELNVESGSVSATALVYASDLISFQSTVNATAGLLDGGLSNLGFITIRDLMTAAAAAICADLYTPAGDALRAYQEALKNTLDAANNNLIFVQPAPTC